MREENQSPQAVSTGEIEALIFSVGAHRVILDADLARLHGVTTKALNQAVKRNRERFPEDFAFRMRPRLGPDVHPQVVDGTGVIEDRSQRVTGSANIGTRDFRRWHSPNTGC